MKLELLDQPEKEIDVIKLACCSYSILGFSVPPPLTGYQKNRLTMGAKKPKLLTKRTKSIKSKLAVA